jgi:hypothetical protein
MFCENYKKIENPSKMSSYSIKNELLCRFEKSFLKTAPFSCVQNLVYLMTLIDDESN